MKKWKLLAGLTLLLLLLLSVTAQADSSSYGVVFGAANVNLRSAPTTSSAVLGAYNKGTWMTVRGYSNGFYQVETPDGRYGWMRQDYLLVSADATGTIGYVSHAGYLNLRREASTSAKVLGKYDDGTPCVILDRAGDWYYVSVGGQTGYFLTRFISTRSGVYSDKLGMVISPNKENVHLRSGPGKNYGSLASIPGCTYVMILQQGNGWWKIAVNGGVGFMSADYFRRRSPLREGGGKQRIRRFFLHGTAGSLCGRQQPESARQAESAQQGEHPRHEVRQVFQRHGGHDDFAGRPVVQGQNARRQNRVYDDRLPFHSLCQLIEFHTHCPPSAGDVCEPAQQRLEIRARAGASAARVNGGCALRRQNVDESAIQRVHRIYDDGVFEEELRQIRMNFGRFRKNAQRRRKKWQFRLRISLPKFQLFLI